MRNHIHVFRYLKKTTYTISSRKYSMSQYEESVIMNLFIVFFIPLLKSDYVEVIY